MPLLVYHTGGRPEGYIGLMLICGYQSIVDVTTEEIVPAEDGPDAPVAFKVHVESHGFSATRLVPIGQREVRTFLSQLRAIERVRQSAATLAGQSPDDFQMRIGFVDRSGRATVSGRLAATEAGAHAPALDFGFEFDPDTLPVIVAEAERWVASPRPSYYLCQLGDLMDGMDEARASEQFTLLASILEKLGYQLASGPADRIDELWAVKRDDDESAHGAALEPASDRRDERAIAFERQFLAWLHIRFGILPTPRMGTNAQWWTFEYGNAAVSFVVVGQTKNGSRPPAPGVDWLLRVEEPEPCTFIERVERHFESGSAVRRAFSGGRIRVQFTSTALARPFVDQTDRT